MQGVSFSRVSVTIFDFYQILFLMKFANILNCYISYELSKLKKSYNMYIS